MKKLLFLLLVPMIVSCGVYLQATNASNSSYIGMTVNEFKRGPGMKAKLEVMGNNRTVYKMYDYDAWTGAIIDTKFFYFDANGKLFEINGGVSKQKRYQIEYK